MEEGKVTFSYKDYRDGEKIKEMILEAEELIRRFLLHVLPDGFVRIRHYGLVANQHRAENLDLWRRLLGVEQQRLAEQEKGEEFSARCQRLTGKDITLCPVCQIGRMARVELIAPLWSKPVQPSPGEDSS